MAGVLAVLQARRADLAAAAADARGASVLALDIDHVDQALLLAAAAARLEDAPDIRASLLRVLLRSPALIGSARAGTGIVPVDSSPVVAVHPHGERVLFGDGATASLRDAGTLGGLDRLDAPPFRAEFRPDGAQLAVSTHGFRANGDAIHGTVPLRLLDATTLAEEPVQLGGWPADRAQGWDLDYSADGSRLAAAVCGEFGVPRAASTCAVLVWDPAAPERPVRLIRPGFVWAVALSPDGNLLYVGTHEPALEVYEVATGELLRSVPVAPALGFGGVAFMNPFDTLEVSPDGSTLAMADVDEVVLTDAATLAERGRLRGHAELVLTLEFSPDGTVLASGSDDGTILVWDVATLTRVDRLLGHTGSARGLGFSPDGATLYSAARDQQLLAWDVRGDRRFIPRHVQLPAGLAAELGNPPFDTVSVAPDGQAVTYFLAATAAEGNVAFLEDLLFLDVAEGRFGDPVRTGHVNLDAAWRPPDYEQFATADESGFVYVWEWRTNVTGSPLGGRLLAERRVWHQRAYAMSYSPDGTELVGVDAAQTLFRVDADTLEPVGEPIPARHEGAQGGELAIRPDGRTAIVLSVDETYTEFDLVEGRVLRHGDLGLSPGEAEFSPDGRLLAVGASSGHVGLMDLETFEWVRPPTPAHNGAVLSLAWAPDGVTFASGGQDGRVRLWDGRTGTVLATAIPGARESWAVVDFLPDGHSLVIATLEGEVFTWDTRLDHWIAQACAIAGRDLTEDEWATAFGDRPYRETCPAR